MLDNKIRETLKSQKAVINGWISTASTPNVLAMANAGYDALTVDLQHGFNDTVSTLELFNAISAKGLGSLARVPFNEPASIMKILDLGACGVVCPVIEDADDAKRFVDASKYPPNGYRSYGPWRAQVMWGGDYTTHANDWIFLVAQIETKKGLDNLEQIASVDGIDCVYFGPMDFAMSVGKTPKFDTDEKWMIENLERFVDVAKESKVYAGMHTTSPDYALKMVDMGYQFVTCGSDIGILGGGAKKMLQSVKTRL